MLVRKKKRARRDDEVAGATEGIGHHFITAVGCEGLRRIVEPSNKVDGRSIEGSRVNAADAIVVDDHDHDRQPIAAYDLCVGMCVHMPVHMGTYHVNRHVYGCV